MSETQHPSANGGGGTEGGRGRPVHHPTEPEACGEEYGGYSPLVSRWRTAHEWARHAAANSPQDRQSCTRPAAGKRRRRRRGGGGRREDSATVMLALAAGVHSGSSTQLLLQAARRLAEEHATTVAVVSVSPPGRNRWTFVTDIVGVESADELPLVRAASDSGPPDMQIARALHRLACGRDVDDCGAGAGYAAISGDCLDRASLAAGQQDG